MCASLAMAVVDNKNTTVCREQAPLPAGTEVLQQCQVVLQAADALPLAGGSPPSRATQVTSSAPTLAQKSRDACARGCLI